jgi:RHS repeat-associated protein
MVSYNNNLMVTSQSMNDGNSVSYGYDDDGLLTSAGSLTISRDVQNGMMTGSTVGSVTDSVAYNGFGELQQYQARYGGSTVFNVDYGTRDKLGRIVTKTETVNGETHTYSYVYDSNTDELTDVYKDGALVSHYDYDANGNRVKNTGSDGTFIGGYDNQDRMLSYGGNTYQYSANGELKSKTNTEGTTVYDYDVLGNLRAITLPDGTRLEYLIDGQNRRIEKKVNGTLVQGFLYQDELNPVAELDGDGNVVSRFVYGTRVNVPDYIVKSGVTYRIFSDQLGSPRVIINTSTGEVVQRMDYDEFGNVTVDTNPGFQPFGLSGGIYDWQMGLIRFGTRDYDPEIGRWTIKDIIGFEGEDTNLFSYVWNDPINFIDPEGFMGQAVAESGKQLIRSAPHPVLKLLGAAMVGVGIGIMYIEGTKDEEVESDECSTGKERSKNPPAKRHKFKSKKDAYEAAKHAGRGKEPIHHPQGEHGPHYHPNVPMPKNSTPKAPNPHDHYYYYY